MNKELKGTSTLHREESQYNFEKGVDGQRGKPGVEKISYVKDDIETYISNAKFGNGNVNF